MNDDEIKEEFDEDSFDGGDDEIAEDATPLSPHCFNPVEPRQYYCPNCGTVDVINPLAAYMPFVQIRFIYGTVVRAWVKSWKFDYSWWVSLLVIVFSVMFLPVIILISLPPVLTFWIKNDKIRNILMLALYILLGLLVVVVTFG